MPTVPTYRPQVRQTPAPAARITPSATPEQFGGGSGQALAEGLSPTIKAVGEIFEKERQKADDVATQRAYTELVTRKNRLSFDPEKGAFSKRGEAAFGVVDEYSPLFEKEADDIEQKMLKTPDQRAMFQRMREQEKREFSGQLQRHVFTETQRFDEETTVAGVKAQMDDAVLNWAEAGRVEKALGLQASMITAHGGRAGKKKEVIEQDVAIARSKTHAAIIDRMLDNDLDGVAAKHFEKYGAQITTATERDHVERRLLDAQTTRRGLEAWDAVKGLRFGNGEFNQRAQENAVMAMDLPPKQKLEVWNFVKARATEATSQLHQAQAAQDHGFLNAAYKARAAGQPIADAMKLVERFGRDAYDRGIKADALRKIYAPKTVSDPRTYMEHWEGVQSGKTSREDLDAALTAGAINVNEYEGLRKDWYRDRIEGKSPEMKAAWEYVDIVADRVGGKEDRDQFKYVLRQKGQGKSADELRAMADEEAKKPGWFRSTRFETSFKDLEATSLARGQLAGSIGQAEAGAVIDGIQKKGDKSVPLKKAVDAFVAELGGPDAMKPGTPVHNAIQSLVKRKKAVTPGNIRGVLQYNSTGKW